MGQIQNDRPFELKAGTATVFGEFSEKLKNNKKAAALGTTPLALILSACGSSDSSTASSSNVLTLTKAADTYSASAVTGFTVTDSSTAKFDVADATSNAYEIKLDATGTGVLEFDFVDAADTVTLITGSKTSGFTTLKVTDGTLDATSADLTGITRVEVASGIKISLAQIKEIPTIVATSATSEITVQVTTEAEATELVSLITAGTVTVFADTNPIKLVAAPTATVATETLETKQTETTASVKPAADAPVDTAVTETTTGTDTSTGTDDTTTDTSTTTDTTTTTDTSTTSGGTSAVVSTAADFYVLKSGVGTYIVGTTNGDVTVTQNGDLDTFTPVTGVAVTKLGADISTLRVDDISLSAPAAFADGKTITGTGNISVTALEGDAAADLSNITASGTRTANVSGDVTFTGDLGTFAVSVDSGKTLTTTAAIASTNTFSGSGTLALTASTGAQAVTATTATINAAMGDGDDTLTLGAAANVTAADSINMGGGTGDVIAISADGDATGAVFDEAGHVGAEQITVAANSTTASTNAKVNLNYSAAYDQDITIDASGMTDSSADFVLAVGTAGNVDGDLTVRASAGANTLAGGDGNDIFEFSAITAFTAADTVAAGGGTGDQIRLTADNSATGGVLDDGHSGVESVVIMPSSTTTDNAKLTLNYAASNTTAITINAAALTDTSAQFTLALGGTTGNVDNVLTVIGGAGNDTIDGGDAADIITAGNGADSISGGGGNDIIVVDADDSASVAGIAGDATGQDHFDDYASGDIIRITGELADGFSAATDVLVGTGTEASDVAVADVDDFLTSTYLVARDGVITDGFDTAIKVTTDGSTVAFASNAAAQAVTAFSVTLAAGATVVLGANADSVTGSTGNDTITGLAGVDALDGGAGDDTFIITDADDDGTGESITGGDGTGDKIDINTTEAINLSNDTIATVEILDLDASGVVNTGTTVTAAQLSAFTTITAAATDTIIVNTLNGATVAGTAAIDKFDFASGDAAVTITGFSVATEVDVLDVIGLSSETYSLLSATETTAAQAANEGSGVTVADTKLALVEVADLTTVDTVAEVVTALVDTGVMDAIDITQGAGNTSLLLIGVDGGTQALLYQFTDDAVASTVDAGELSLVATITGPADIISDIAAGNFAFS